ncbi:hypothetical protein ATR1_248c0001, partial [Acetobacter tropicalis]
STRKSHRRVVHRVRLCKSLFCTKEIFV